MLNLNRDEDRRKAVKVSVESLKGFDPLRTLSELNEHAIHMCKLGIKRQNPNISEGKLLEELQRIINLGRHDRLL